MQAGVFDRPLSWREVFSWPVRPPRPAVALARSMGGGMRPVGGADPTVRLASRSAEKAIA